MKSRLMSILGTAVVVSTISLPANAAKVRVLNLMTGARLQGVTAVEAVCNYMKGGDNPPSCKGVDRTAGVKSMEVARDTENGLYWVTGSVWANSNHPHGLAYGGDCDVANEVGAGYFPLKFTFPIFHDDVDGWLADAGSATLPNDSKVPVADPTTRDLQFNNPNFGLLGNLLCALGPGRCEISTSQIFVRIKPFLDRYLAAPQALAAGGGQHPEDSSTVASDQQIAAKPSSGAVESKADKSDKKDGDNKDKTDKDDDNNSPGGGGLVTDVD